MLHNGALRSLFLTKGSKQVNHMKHLSIYLFLVVVVTACGLASSSSPSNHEPSTDISESNLPESTSTPGFLSGPSEEDFDSTPPVTATIGSREQIPLYWLELLEIPITSRFGMVKLSPNGEWVMSTRGSTTEEAQMLRLTSTITEGLSLSYAEEAALGKYDIFWGSWAPNSTAITAFGIDSPGGGCLYHRLIIYQFDTKNMVLSPSTFEPPSGGANCIRVSWSPDNTLLAVHFSPHNKDTIFIINRQGEIIQRITLSLEEDENLVQLRWTTFGLLYLVDYISVVSGTSEKDVELRQIQFEPSIQKRTVISKKGEWYLASVDPGGAASVILGQQILANENTFYQFDVLNLVNSNIEYTFELEGSSCHSEDSTQTSTAFICYNPNTLWIFDWQNNLLTNYGAVNDLLGWYDNFPGFLLLEKKDETFHLEVIQP